MVFFPFSILFAVLCCRRKHSQHGGKGPGASRVPAGAGVRWAIAAVTARFSLRRVSDDGAAAAAPLGVVQRIHLVFEPIDVVEVRLP